jgi:hypothetical protein
MSRHPAAVCALLVLGVLAGCGPSAGLDVGVKHEGAGVFFGVTPNPTPTPPPPPPHAELVPNFPAPLVAPPRPPSKPSPTPSPSPSACPTPGPVTYPKVAATTTATQPPAQATYDFRYTGTETFNPGMANQQVKQLPTTGTHQVVNVSQPAADGHYSFDIVELYNGFTTTTTFLVEPTSTPSLLGTAQAGLYLQSMKSTDSSGATPSFTPQPPVELVPFPVNPGTQFQSAGVDPLTRTTMEEDSPGGVVGTHENVPTCGDVVDSWHVGINGRFIKDQGNTVTTFVITFNVATQYGGLLVQQHTVENGTDQVSGQTFTYDVSETINTVPQ